MKACVSGYGVIGPLVFHKVIGTSYWTYAGLFCPFFLMSRHVIYPLSDEWKLSWLLYKDKQMISPFVLEVCLMDHFDRVARVRITSRLVDYFSWEMDYFSSELRNYRNDFKNQTIFYKILCNRRVGTAINILEHQNFISTLLP